MHFWDLIGTVHADLYFEQLFLGLKKVKLVICQILIFFKVGISASQVKCAQGFSGGKRGSILVSTDLQKSVRIIISLLTHFSHFILFFYSPTYLCKYL